MSSFRSSGDSALKWLPVFLGLRPIRGRVLLLAVVLNSSGVLVAIAGWMKLSAFLLLVQQQESPAKIDGLDQIPVFHAELPDNTFA